MTQVHVRPTTNYRYAVDTYNKNGGWLTTSYFLNSSSDDIQKRAKEDAKKFARQCRLMLSSANGGK